MSSRRVRPTHRAHNVTTFHAGSIFPSGGDSLGLPAVYVGDDVLGGGAFAFDEFLGYNASPRVLSSPNMVVVGMVGHWKSSLSKTMIYRQVGMFGDERQAWVLDPKGEYGPLTEAMGCRSIALSPGGKLRLNPLDPVGGWAVQSSLLSAVAAAALRRPLGPVEEAGAREALLYVIERNKAGASHGQPTIPDVAETLLRPPARVAEQLNMSPEDMTSACRDVALALSRLVAGDLRGMFDGPTTPGLGVDGRMVHLDLSAVYDSAALGVLMTCTAAWMRAQMDAARAAGVTRLMHVVYDEAWRMLAQESTAAWMQESTKLSRSLGRAVRLIMHRLSDPLAAGDAGSRVAQLAEGLLSECETVVMYRQPPQELERLQRMVGLTDRERETVGKLPPGVALWRVGSRSFLVRHNRSSVEVPFTDTDAGMGATAAGGAA